MGVLGRGVVVVTLFMAAYGLVAIWPVHERRDTVDVVPVEWRVIGPDLIQAVNRAEQAARIAALADMNAWREEMLVRADVSLFPWQDEFIRRRIANNWFWLVELAKSFSFEAANRSLIEEAQREFAARVASPEAMQARLKTIAFRSASAFQVALAAEFEARRVAVAIPAPAFEAALQQVTFTPRKAAVGGATVKAFKLTELALRKTPVGAAARYVATGAAGANQADLLIRAYTDWTTLTQHEWAEVWSMTRMATILAGNIRTVAIGTSTAVKAALAGKVTAATLGLGGAVLVTGAVAYDLFSDPTPRRRQMRDTLDVMLKGMMDEALAEGGIIGAGLARMATGVREAIEAEIPGRRRSNRASGTLEVKTSVKR